MPSDVAPTIAAEVAALGSYQDVTTAADFHFVLLDCFGRCVLKTNLDHANVGREAAHLICAAFASMVFVVRRAPARVTPD